MKGNFLLWALHIAGVTSLKLMPFKIWELSEPHFRPQTRVYGGTTVKEGEFPFMVFILFKSETGDINRCSACLVLPGWVLTAAHCLNSENISPSNVILTGGKADLTDYVKQRLKINFESNINETNLEVQERRAQEIHSHPEFLLSDEEILHDIAFVKLEKPFIVTENLKPISLNFDKIDSGISCTILGWGKIPRNTTYHLHAARENKISTSSNGCIYTKLKPLICLSFDRLAGICEGDSGSPLVCNGKVVGVASYFLSINEQCEDSLEDYYSELSVEKKWIQSVLNTSSKTAEIDFTQAFTIVFTALWISRNIS